MEGPQRARPRCGSGILALRQHGNAVEDGGTRQLAGLARRSADGLVRAEQPSDLAALDEACFLQTLAERMCNASASDVLRKKPTTGICACCARAASGHAAAVPPRSVMNSRRLTPIMNLSSLNPVLCDATAW
jgi:hypothetical protein